MNHRTVSSLDHDELATLAREFLLAGHMIDRAGMPQVVSHGIDVMRDVAIDEWMGASPIYTKRMQRLLRFEGDTVETAFKGMQFDIGAPPEFLDFRYVVHDDHHGEFHLDHCGALMDVEPMGEDFVVAMCHDIEDPTFDATGWASNPKLRMRPVHRPPRTPADRQPHCAWTVTIDDDIEPNPEPEQSIRLGSTLAAQHPLPSVDDVDVDGMTDYTNPLDPDLQMRDFGSAALRAILDEFGLQGHLLSLSFLRAVEDRFGTEVAVDAGAKQLCGVAGVAAERLVKAFSLPDSAEGVASVFDLHPAFHPRSYVPWEVAVDGDRVELTLGDGPARHESGYESWISILADGHVRALSAIAAAVDPHWTVAPAGPGHWVVERGDSPAKELSEVTLTKFSTGALFEFSR